jgi:phosphoribosylanthranilate isomerase
MTLQFPSPKVNRTRIKFCGLVRAQDVHFAARLGVDALGLVFYTKSSRYVSLDEAKALRRLMPSYVSCVGLFVNAPPEEVRTYRSTLGLDVVQFHGDETTEQIEHSMDDESAIYPKSFNHGPDLASISPPFWRALRVKPDSDLLELAANYPGAEALLLDAYSEAFGGTGKRFDWSLAKQLPSDRIVLSGGLDAESVGDGIAGLRPFAVDVSSGIQGEDARVKSPERMEQFVAAVQKADFLKVSR